MVVVNDLNEWLDLGSLGHLLRSHVSGHFQWVSLNTSNQSMAEWVGLGALIVRLDNHNLLTGVTTANDDSCNLVSILSSP